MNRKHVVITSIIFVVAVLLGFALIKYLSSEGEFSIIPGGSCVEFSSNVSKDDGALIQELIGTLGNTSTIGLLGKKGRLESIGDTIDAHVPPFTFLSYIFSNKALAHDMALIKKSGMKYGNFLGGLHKNFMKYNQECFFQNAEALCKFLGIDWVSMKPIWESSWEDAKGNKKAFQPVVDFLIQKKSG